MNRTTVLVAVVSLAALAAVCLGPVLAADKPASTGSNRVFEMRTYYTHPGRLEALNKRFAEHTCDLFKKHGMEIVGFWTPIDEKDGKDDKLVYILAYPSRESAQASWKAFQADPVWIKARDASEVDGKIVKKVESIYLNPTQYSLIK